MKEFDAPEKAEKALAGDLVPSGQIFA